MSILRLTLGITSFLVLQSGPQYCSLDDFNRVLSLPTPMYFGLLSSQVVKNHKKIYPCLKTDGSIPNSSSSFEGNWAVSFNPESSPAWGVLCVCLELGKQTQICYIFCKQSKPGTWLMVCSLCSWQGKVPGVPPLSQGIHCSLLL